MNVSNLMAVLKTRKEVRQTKKVAGTKGRGLHALDAAAGTKNLSNSFLRYNDEMLMQTVTVLMSVN
jgi:hypothetical protein